MGSFKQNFSARGIRSGSRHGSSAQSIQYLARDDAFIARNSGHSQSPAFLEKYPSITFFIRFVLADYHIVSHTTLLTKSPAIILAKNPSDTGVLSTAPSTTYYGINGGHYDLDKIYAGEDQFIPDWEMLKPILDSDRGLLMCWIKEKKEPEPGVVR